MIDWFIGRSVVGRGEGRRKQTLTKTRKLSSSEIVVYLKNEWPCATVKMDRNRNKNGTSAEGVEVRHPFRTWRNSNRNDRTWNPMKNSWRIATNYRSIYTLMDEFRRFSILMNNISNRMLWVYSSMKRHRKVFLNTSLVLNHRSMINPIRHLVNLINCRFPCMISLYWRHWKNKQQTTKINLII